MKRDEAKQSLLDYYNAVRSYFDAYLHGIGDIAKAQQNLNSIMDKLLAALAGSDRPEGPGRHNLTITVLLQQGPRGLIFEMNGKLFRAEDIPGTWRKVEP